MKTYGQFCPVAKAAELFCQRWTPLLIRDLAGGPRRFSALQKGVPLMSPSLLSKRLRDLRAEGIVTRDGERGPYRLTEAGSELVPVVLELAVWGQRWTRRELAEDEVDLGLFLWAFEQSVRPEAFGDGQVVVELLLHDQPPNKRLWWLINRPDGVELCLEPPGFEVDLWVRATLPDMIRAWRGDVDLAAAMGDERIDVQGSRRLRRAFLDWFGRTVVADVASRRSA